jgi:hypothetical protein
MKRMKIISRPPPPPPEPIIEPIPLTGELQRLNTTLRCEEDFMHIPQHGTPPVRVQRDLAALSKRKSFTWFLHDPTWSAKKVLAARASTVFIDRQNWLWEKVDRCGDHREARKQALYARIELARENMERRNAEFYEEERVLQQVQEAASQIDQLSCK